MNNRLYKKRKIFFYADWSISMTNNSVVRPLLTDDETYQKDGDQRQNQENHFCFAFHLHAQYPCTVIVLGVSYLFEI